MKGSLENHGVGRISEFHFGLDEGPAVPGDAFFNSLSGPVNAMGGAEN